MTCSAHTNTSHGCEVEEDPDKNKHLCSAVLGLPSGELGYDNGTIC